MPTANAANNPRGYEKLSAAALSFSYDFRGKVVLDLGSSTGGFTKYALEAGAARVIALEKGTNQMMAPLRFDPRVDLREKTDLFTVTREDLGPVDTILADISFCSLKKVLSYAREHYLTPGHPTDFLVMLKPQFEARPTDLNKGVVKNETIRRRLIKEFESWLKTHGFLVVQKRDNTLAGRTGNLERFYLLKSCQK